MTIHDFQANCVQVIIKEQFQFRSEEFYERFVFVCKLLKLLMRQGSWQEVTI